MKKLLLGLLLGLLISWYGKPLYYDSFVHTVKTDENRVVCLGWDNGGDLSIDKCANYDQFFEKE